MKKTYKASSMMQGIPNDKTIENEIASMKARLILKSHNEGIAINEEDFDTKIETLTLITVSAKVIRDNRKNSDEIVVLKQDSSEKSRNIIKFI